MSDARGEADKLRVFISYSRDDLVFADQLDLALELAGFEPTLDRHSIYGAEDWQEKLSSLIREADTIVFVLSPFSAQSTICLWEVDQAVALGKRIIPVVCRTLAAVPAPPALAALNNIYCYAEEKNPGSGYRPGMAELIKALKIDLGWLREHTRYLQRALEWQAGQRQPNRLLSGVDVAEAKAWLNRQPKETPPPTSLHLDFIKASEGWESEQANERARQLEEREWLVREAEAAAAREAEAQAEREKEREAREGAQAAVAEAAKREAALARRVARRSFVGLVTALMLAAAAAVAGGLAQQQRQDALAQARRAAEATEEAQAQTAAAAAANVRARTFAKVASNWLADAASRLDAIDLDAGSAVLLALEALPDQVLGIDQPYAPVAEGRLNRALSNLHERAVLAGHGSGVKSAAWSPTGRYIVTGSGTTASVWEAESAKVLVQLEGHYGAINNTAWSPDGKRIVTAAWDNTARVWEVTSGKELARLDGHSFPVNAASWSSDGTLIVTASEDKTARVWDAASGKELVRLDGHMKNVSSAVWNPDGARIVTASDDKTARVWDAASGKELSRLEGHDRWILSAAWSPDGARVVTASHDETARVWDAMSGKELVRLEGHCATAGYNPSGCGVTSAEWSPSGERIVTASEDKTARVWDAASGKELARLVGHCLADVDYDWGGCSVTSASWNPDGSHIVTASQDGTARIWGPKSDQELVRFEGHTSAVRAAAWSPDGARIVTASQDKTARVWDAASGKELARLEGHCLAEVDYGLFGCGVSGASWNPDGTRIVTASQDKTARVWDAASGKELVRLAGHCLAEVDYGLSGCGVKGASWSSDGTRIITASDDKTARVWDGATGRELVRLEGHRMAVNSAAWSPDGTRIVTASNDNTARVWDGASGRELAWLEGHTMAVNSAAWSPDGVRIVTASDDITARVWEAATGKELARLAGHRAMINGAAWRPDGTRIVTTSADKTSRIWEVTTGNEVAELDGHRNNVESAVWSADGARIVTSSGDGTARVWETESGQELAQFKNNTESMSGAAWSPDGTRIVTASHGPIARLWRVMSSTQELVNAGKDRMQRCLTPVQRKKYFLPLAPPIWCIERHLWPYHTDVWQEWLLRHKTWRFSARQGPEPALPK